LPFPSSRAKQPDLFPRAALGRVGLRREGPWQPTLSNANRWQALDFKRRIPTAVYHVYILASASGVLYTGITNFLERRVRQHKAKLVDGFTKQYDVTRLVYYEPHGQPKSAIRREKQIKSWRREKKLALIRSMNPKFRDLSEDFPH
jgi:putative endonuclease